MARTKITQRKRNNYIQAIQGIRLPQKDFTLPEKLKREGLAIKRRQARKDVQRQDPWVLNFPPCRGPGGSIPTGNVASLVSSNCPL